MTTSTAVSPVTVPQEDVDVESKLLGPLSIMESQVYHFAEGLYGFPEATAHALIPVARDGFFWLQSLEFSALTFLLIDPFMFVDGYAVDLNEGELADMGADDPSTILILSILTLPRDSEGCATVNLQGPLAFNIRQQRGKQTVIDSMYGLRHPVEVNSPSLVE